MAQFILSDEEITLLHDSLITEITEWEDDLKISERKGRDGKFELDQIKLLEKLKERLDPYLKQSDTTYKQKEMR